MEDWLTLKDPQSPLRKIRIFRQDPKGKLKYMGKANKITHFDRKAIESGEAAFIFGKPLRASFIVTTTPFGSETKKAITPKL